MKLHNSPIIIAGCLILILGAGCSQKGSDPSEAVLNPVESSTQIETETRQNANLIPEITLPKGWFIEHVSSTEVGLFKNGQPGLQDEAGADIVIAYEQNPQHLPVLEFMRQSGQVPLDAAVAGVTTTTINGHTVWFAKKVPGINSSTIAVIESTRGLFVVTDALNAHQEDGVFNNIVGQITTREPRL